MIPVSVPTTDRKVTGLKSESLLGFTPGSCPDYFRNADRINPGIPPALPRNPHFASITCWQRAAAWRMMRITVFFSTSSSRAVARMEIPSVRQFTIWTIFSGASFRPAYPV
jgi:hypothetical protein